MTSSARLSFVHVEFLLCGMVDCPRLLHAWTECQFTRVGVHIGGAAG